MKARLFSESDTRQETAPEENAKEYTKKRCIKGRLDAAVRNTLGLDKEVNNVQI